MILNQPYRNQGGGDVAVADLEGDGDLDVVISWGDAIEVLQATTNPFAFVARAAFSRPAGYSTGSFWDDWGGPDGPSLSLGTSTGTIRVQED